MKNRKKEQEERVSGMGGAWELFTQCRANVIEGNLKAEILGELSALPSEYARDIIERLISTLQAILQMSEDDERDTYLYERDRDQRAKESRKWILERVRAVAEEQAKKNADAHLAESYRDIMRQYRDDKEATPWLRKVYYPTILEAQISLMVQSGAISEKQEKDFREEVRALF